MTSQKSISRTLLVQFADIGDLLLAAPAIQYFRETNPERHLTLLTKPSNVELAEQLADEVLLADKHLYDSPLGLLNVRAGVTLLRFGLALRRKRFDEVILLHHMVTGWGRLKFALLMRLTGAKIRRGLARDGSPLLTFPVRDRGFGVVPESQYWVELLGGAADPALRVDTDGAVKLLDQHRVRGPYVVLHPGSGSFSTARRWPLDRFEEVADALKSRLGLHIVVVGGAFEAHLGVHIERGRSEYVANMCGETDLALLGALLSRAEVFLGNDGGVAQLSGLMGVRTIVVYGPTSPATWLPAGTQTIPIRRDLPCSPCIYRYSELGTPEGCATRECLLDLSSKRVIENIISILSQPRAA